MPLTHIDAEGKASMVDIGNKPISARSAVARGKIRMLPATVAAITSGTAPKGDVLAAARLAGIQAAKSTSDLIPLCHIVPLDSVRVDIEHTSNDGFLVVARVTCTGRTGVEMEALTAVSVGLLTLYDMAKSMDESMVIERIELVEKVGGVRGDWRRDDLGGDSSDVSSPNG